MLASWPCEGLFTKACELLTYAYQSTLVGAAMRVWARGSSHRGAATAASRRLPAQHDFVAGRASTGAPCPGAQLNAGTRGFMLAYMPLGFGYQVQTCIVTSLGCQSLNAAPEAGLVFAQASALGSETKVPSL